MIKPTVVVFLYAMLFGFPASSLAKKKLPIVEYSVETREGAVDIYLLR